MFLCSNYVDLPITSSQPTASQIGISEALSVDIDTEEKNVSITLEITDSNGFTISSISGNTTESGGTATFTVKLKSEPDDDVVLDVATSDSSEGTVSPETLTFTPSNYDDNQTVTVTGVDLLEASIGYAKAHRANAGISFKVGDAHDIPFEDSSFDAGVSGLMIKFVPDKLRAISEMKRVTRAGGQIALYDWDMERNRNMTRHFWQAVADSVPELIEGRATDRPPMKEAGTVADKFREAGLSQIEEKSFTFTAHFTDFDDYRHPMTHNVQNVGRFYQTLTDDHRTAIFDRIREILPIATDGSISFESQASAVKGQV